MKSNKSRVTLTLIAIALIIFGLSQCRSKDEVASTTSPTAKPVETKAVVTEKAPDASAPKAAEPTPAAQQPKSVEKKEKSVPAPGLPPEHRPIF